MSTPATRALIEAALAAPPIGLDAVRASADLLTRCDRSYAVPADAFAAFAARLVDPARPGGGFRSLRIGGRRWFRYHSVYYDTPDLRLFDDHRKGRRHRYKLRERLYEDSGERQFEIKLKGPRGETVKHRTELTGRPDAANAWNPHTQRFTADVLRDSYGLAVPGALRPTLLTDYVRTTFATAGQRITCDVELVCNDLATGRELWAAPELVLVEVKAEREITMVDRLLHGFGARPMEFNKYCAGLATLRPTLRDNLWRSGIRRCFPEHRGRRRAVRVPTAAR